MQFLKIETECPMFKNWLTSCELNANRTDRSRFGKERQFNRFREESERTVKNWEILTCLSWEEFPRLFNAKRALNTHLRDYFIVHVVFAFMPSPERKRIITTQFVMMSVPFFSEGDDGSRGAKYGQSWWQYDHWKARDASKGARQQGKNPLCNDGRKMKRILVSKLFIAGHKNIVVTWTILHFLTYHTSQHGKSDQGMKTV